MGRMKDHVQAYADFHEISFGEAFELGIEKVLGWGMNNKKENIKDPKNLLADIGLFLGRASFSNKEDEARALKLKNIIVDTLSSYKKEDEIKNDSSINQEF
jgi:hypothetical protein